MAIKRYEQEDYANPTAQQQAQAARLAAEQAAAQQAQAKAAQTTAQQQAQAARLAAEQAAAQQAQAKAAQTQQTQQQAATTNTKNPNNPNGINPKGIVKTGTSAKTTAAATQPAQEALQSYQTLKPANYDSKYTQQLDAILNQIQNPEQFKWDFNGDELFKYYADLYSQKGKQASMDAMGQAAALTGGYGNSYAQQVGQQTYDDYMLGLYDKGMEMRDDAWNRYVYEKDQLKNQYNLLMNTDQTEYSRFRDTISDWQNDRDYNYNLAMNILAKGQMPSDAMLAAAGLTAADAKKLMAKKSSSGGGSGKKGREVVLEFDGKLYKENEDGKKEEVSEQYVRDNNVLIDTTYQDKVARALQERYLTQALGYNPFKK